MQEKETKGPAAESTDPLEAMRELVRKASIDMDEYWRFVMEGRKRARRSAILKFFLGCFVYSCAIGVIFLILTLSMIFALNFYGRFL